MKRLLFWVGIFAAISIPAASAADLAPRIFTKAPPSPDNWSGGYVGISGGGGFGHSNQTDLGGPGLGGGGGGGGGVGDGSYSVNGGLLGGTIGYNWQAGRWVYGFEGDYSWADVSGRSDTCGLSAGNPHPCGTKLSSLGTLRGRVGYAAGATGNWLLYATGGLAVGEVGGWDALMPASGGMLRAGWTAGAGVETVIAPRWTVKAEYLYVDLGKAQLFDIQPGIPETVSFNAHIIRAGINYKLPAGNTSVASFPGEPARNWTGFYVGGHVGGSSVGSNLAFQQDDGGWWTNGGSGVVPIRGETALLGGAQAGFNYQLGSIVAGVEGTWSALNLKTAVVSPFYPDSDGFSRKVTGLYTVAARLGVTWDRVLFYGKGGWAGGEIEVAGTSTAGPTTWMPGSKSRSGIVVGGGMEYMVTPNLIAGIDYNHIDLGRSNYAAFNVGDNSATITSVDDRTKVDSVVGRLSYKFDPSLGFGHR